MSYHTEHKRRDMVRTVADLRAKLEGIDGATPIVATWESIFRRIAIYRAENGAVVIDADDSGYRADIEAGLFIAEAPDYFDEHDDEEEP